VPVECTLWQEPADSAGLTRGLNVGQVQNLNCKVITYARGNAGADAVGETVAAIRCLVAL
jgi:hypothetical protein